MHSRGYSYASGLSGKLYPGKTKTRRPKPPGLSKALRSDLGSITLRRYINLGA